MPIASIASTGPSEIWEFPIDGGAPRRVPDADPRSHREAAYSSDGARVAFIDYADSYSLVIAKADGTELRVLPGAVNGPNGPGKGAVYQNLVVSPTGDRVAFIWRPAVYESTSDPALSIYELRVIDVASGTVTTLAHETERSLDRRHHGSHPGATGSSTRQRTPTAWGRLSTASTSTAPDPQVLVTGTGWGDWQTLPTRP